MWGQYYKTFFLIFWQIWQMFQADVPKQKSSGQKLPKKEDFFLMIIMKKNFWTPDNFFRNIWKKVLQYWPPVGLFG